MQNIRSSKQVAGIIAGEVIESGKSNGWQGSLEEVAQIEKILSRFNIVYVDDFVGEWGQRQGKWSNLLNIKYFFGCRC